jgi:hypothetical protein
LFNEIRVFDQKMLFLPIVIIYGTDLWQIPTREMKKKMIYRNGRAEEVSKKIKEGKNKK